MADSQRLSLALAHAAAGREIFPFSLMPPDKGGRRQKIPKVKWTVEATTDEDTIRGWWRKWPLAMPGWKLPPGVVVVDVDDPSAFEAAGLEIDLTTSTQLTPRGGYHLAFTFDLGREVRQTVKEIEGADTRVGGRGWVGLYDDDSFAQEMRPAPEWLYDIERPRSEPSDDDLEELGTRDEIMRWVGGLRRARMSGEEILSALFVAREEGRIVALDESRPWTDADLRAIAKEAGKWEPGPNTDWLEASFASLAKWKERTRGKAEKLPPKAPEGARKLIVPIDEYRRGVPKAIPWVATPFLYHGGVTMLAGPPKGGKSTLMANLQAALETGDEFLGVKVTEKPTLLVTEEGGVAVVYKTKGLGRLEVLDKRAATLAGLGYKETLAAVRDWCNEWEEPAVVFIDTLAVWAELEDENSATAVTKALNLVNQLAAETQAAVVIVHHTRKGGGKDGEAIRGSSAIFASVDIAMELSRPREGSTDRKLEVSGRVVLPSVLDLEFDEKTLSYGLMDVYNRGDADDPVMALPQGAARSIALWLRAQEPDEWWLLEAIMEGVGLTSKETARAAMRTLGAPKYRLRVERRGQTPWYRMRPFSMEGTPHAG